MDYKLKKISKTISYILRHHPEEYNIKLDKQGWTDLHTLCDRLRITEDDVQDIIDSSNKVRYEIKDGRIRAAYGHSLNFIQKDEVAPPDILYHGTTAKAFFSINKEGIRHMDRQHVHLSEEKVTATKVARRRSQNIVLIKVNAKQAYEDGIKFYEGNDTTWLSDDIEPKYFISVERI